MIEGAALGCMRKQVSQVFIHTSLAGLYSSLLSVFRQMFLIDSAVLVSLSQTQFLSCLSPLSLIFQKNLSSGGLSVQVDGSDEGTVDGVTLGISDGALDGTADGVLLGVNDGLSDAVTLGFSDGTAEGIADGPLLGNNDGESDAVTLGL